MHIFHSSAAAYPILYVILQFAMHICQGLVFHALEKPQRGGGGIELSRRRTFPLWRHPASAAYSVSLGNFILSSWTSWKGIGQLLCADHIQKPLSQIDLNRTKMKAARYTLLWLPPIGLKLEELYLYQSGRPKFTSKYHLEEATAAKYFLGDSSVKEGGGAGTPPIPLSFFGIMVFH